MISLDLSKKIYVVPVSKKSCEFSIYVLFYFIVIWNIKTPQPNRWYYYSLYCTTILLGPFRSRFAKLWRSVLCQNTKVHLIYGSFLWDYSPNAQQRWCHLQNWKACQKVDHFTRLFLSIMAQCAINKKMSFLSETVWKIKENTKKQDKYVATQFTGTVKFPVQWKVLRNILQWKFTGFGFDATAIFVVFLN